MFNSAVLINTRNMNTFASKFFLQIDYLWPNDIYLQFNQSILISVVWIPCISSVCLLQIFLTSLANLFSKYIKRKIFRKNSTPKCLFNYFFIYQKTFFFTISLLLFWILYFLNILNFLLSLSRPKTQYSWVCWYHPWPTTIVRIF